MTTFEGNQVRCTLRVRMCECVIFSYVLSCHALGELRFDFYLGHSFFHVINSLKVRKLKCGEIKVLRYYKARVYTSPKIQRPVLINKYEKLNKAVNLITITFLKQLHNNQNKINARE